MGRDSKIEWTHHTFNPWWGCTKVSHGCANCYAESFDKRVHGAEKTHWGPGSSRRMFGDKHWNDDLMPLLTEPTGEFRTFEGRRQMEVATTGAVHWVIVGGESGRGARPMRADWVRNIRDQCQQLGVAFHFKQWGEHDSGLVRVGKKSAGRVLDGRAWDGLPH